MYDTVWHRMTPCHHKGLPRACPRCRSTSNRHPTEIKGLKLCFQRGCFESCTKQSTCTNSCESCNKMYQLLRVENQLADVIHRKREHQPCLVMPLIWAYRLWPHLSRHVNHGQWVIGCKVGKVHLCCVASCADVAKELMRTRGATLWHCDSRQMSTVSSCTLNNTDTVSVSGVAHP